jgi:ribose-phosphate pyrophosphokinase
MTPVVFGTSPAARAIAAAVGGEPGRLTCRQFPDGETYVRLDTTVANREVLFVEQLDAPDDKVVGLLFAAAAARQQDARRIGLVAPYLPYMRQDTRFQPGEAVTSAAFAAWLSASFDWLVTVDPHLHRYRDLAQVYTIPTRIVPAAPSIAQWISANVERPLLVGPDQESEQWVGAVAALAHAPHEILTKVRRGDRDVSVSPLVSAAAHGHTPVLVDDIVSSGHTMAVAARELTRCGLPAPVCIGVHGIFAGDALEVLRAAQPAAIVTCNTIAHPTNAIDLDVPIAEAVSALLAGQGTPAKEAP